MRGEAGAFDLACVASVGTDGCGFEQLAQRVRAARPRECDGVLDGALSSRVPPTAEVPSCPTSEQQFLRLVSREAYGELYLPQLLDRAGEIRRRLVVQTDVGDFVIVPVDADDD